MENDKDLDKDTDSVSSDDKQFSVGESLILSQDTEGDVGFFPNVIGIASAQRRRIAILEIDATVIDVLININRDIFFKATSRLPADARLVNWNYNEQTGKFQLFYESVEFELVGQGERVATLPWGTVEFYKEE